MRLQNTQHPSNSTVTYAAQPAQNNGSFLPALYSSNQTPVKTKNVPATSKVLQTSPSLPDITLPDHEDRPLPALLRQPPLPQKRMDNGYDDSHDPSAVDQRWSDADAPSGAADLSSAKVLSSAELADDTHEVVHDSPADHLVNPPPVITDQADVLSEAAQRQASVAIDVVGLPLVSVCAVCVV